jgi:S1-C subfamily serine protease
MRSKEGDITNPCRVFIGVETHETEAGQLVIDGIVPGTPAEKAGLQEGDIILSMDGQAVDSHEALLQARNKRQAGDAFSLAVLRDGVRKEVPAQFKACSEAERAEYQQRLAKAESMLNTYREAMNAGQSSWTERPILGIYPGEELATGLTIGSVISGKGAEAAGLRSGDVITAVDGQPVGMNHGLSPILSNYQSGESVTVSYLRDGTPGQTVVTLSANRTYFRHVVERDPCAVFIGVYTNDDAEGVKVTGVIDNTPAKRSDIQPGDRILAIDGKVIKTHQELRAGRDLHKPGEAFQLTILRNGGTKVVDSRFLSCDTQAEPAQTTEEAVTTLDAEVEPEAAPSLPVVEIAPDRELPLEAYSLFPNPTFGLVNLRFEGAAAPTVVRIQDAGGRVVFERSLPQFGGQFNEQINLSGNPAGTYAVTILQNGRVRTTQLVLMPRV